MENGEKIAFEDRRETAGHSSLRGPGSGLRGVFCLECPMVDPGGLMDPRLKRSVEGKKGRLDACRPFPPAVVRKLDEQFALEWTRDSNAMEGNTLSLRETELVMLRGLTVGGKSLREHFEVVNHAKAIQELNSFVEKNADFSEEFVLRLHRSILANIGKRWMTSREPVEEYAENRGAKKGP